MSQSIDDTKPALKPAGAPEGPSAEEWSAKEAAAFLADRSIDIDKVNQR